MSRKTARLTTDVYNSVGLQKNSITIQSCQKFVKRQMELPSSYNSQMLYENSLACDMDVIDLVSDDIPEVDDEQYIIAPPSKKQKTPQYSGYPYTLKNSNGKTLKDMFGIEDVSNLSPYDLELISAPFVEEKVPWGGELVRKFTTHRSNSRVQLFKDVTIGLRHFDKPVIIKTQGLPPDHFDFNDSVIREWTTHMRLSDAQKNGEITNFVPILHWFLQYESDPDELFLNIVMPDVGVTIRNLAKDSITTRGFKEIIFQLLWSLASADKAFHFRHQDLHGGNLLVKRLTPGGSFVYSDENGSSLCRVTEYIVTIIDFGNVQYAPPLSRDKRSVIELYDELKKKRLDATETRRDVSRVKTAINEIHWNNEEIFSLLKSPIFHDLKQ